MVGTTGLNRRRFLISAGASVFLCSVLGPTARAEPAQRILSIAYSGSVTLDPNIQHLADNLRATGAQVTDVIGPSSGDLASLLSQNSFDQIFIWDMSVLPPVNAADKAALLAWWGASPRNLVLDSRAPGLFYENDPSEQALCRNIVHNFAARGGGLWIGAGYAPQAARTANAYLAALDPNAPLFAGTYSDTSIVTGTDNPLLGVPNVVNAAGLRWSAFGEFGRSAAPLTGPGAIPLEIVARDAEMHPLITTNIPEPPSFLGMGLGGATMFACRRPKR